MNCFKLVLYSVDCWSGEYFNQDTNKCQPCPEDTFSNGKIALVCTPCGDDEWTVGKVGQSLCGRSYIMLCQVPLSSWPYDFRDREAVDRLPL